MPGSFLSVGPLVPALVAAAIVGTDRRIRRSLTAAGANSQHTAIALGAPRMLRRWRALWAIVGVLALAALWLTVTGFGAFAV